MPEDDLPESTLSMPEIQKKLDQHLKKRGKKLERFEKIALFGEPYEVAERMYKETGKGYNHRPLPSDPPDIQMLFMLNAELKNEDADWKQIEPGDARRATAKMGIMKQMTEIINTINKTNSDTFAEYSSIIDKAQRGKEHEDRMRLAEGKQDQDLSDAEIIEKAKKLGIQVQGD